MQVKKISYQGEIYTPVYADDGHVLLMDELEALAVEPIEAPERRLAKAVLITNETPPSGPMPAKNFDVPQDCKLMLADSGLPLATIEEVEPVDGPDPHVVAIAKFLRTRLAEIAYRAMCDGILSGVCCVILFGEREGRAIGVVQEVQLGAIETSCLPSAKIWPIDPTQ